MKLLQVFENTVGWIERNSIKGEGIAVFGGESVPYPEVTGYYIPTLLEWGYRDLAKKYVEWLCCIQNSDGSWNDPNNLAPYVFDTAQIIKGLLAYSDIEPKLEKNIIKGCDWILGNIQENGRLLTPDDNAWGDGTFCSELVHLYCLSPLYDCAKKYQILKYQKAADKVLNYYITNYMDDIMDFKLLSHFYSYIIEGLIDVGNIDIAKKAMMRLDKYMNKDGFLPGVKNAKWVCSTGLFQLALIWYKLEEVEKGNKIFNYACSLQNSGGGWYGSYNVDGKKIKKNVEFVYFYNKEISWANKYYLDALAYQQKLSFNSISHIFTDQIDLDDGRYQLILGLLRKLQSEQKIKVCDVGCGKGRYLFNLKKEISNVEWTAVDISDKVMENFSEDVEKQCGTLLQIPYKNDTFDFVYAVESLEHAIHVKNAVRELVRVTKKGGTIVIIDREYRTFSKLKLAPYEQWIKSSDMKKWAEENHCRISTKKNILYEGKQDGLFNAWIIYK